MKDATIAPASRFYAKLLERSHWRPIGTTTASQIAKSLSRLGADQVWPNARMGDAPGREWMTWMPCGALALSLGLEPVHDIGRPIDDDGCDCRAHIDHRGWFTDDFEEDKAYGVVMPVRVPRRMGRPGKHPISNGSYRINESRILWTWGVAKNGDSGILIARTLAPGQRTAAEWADRAAELLAERERAFQRKESLKMQLEEAKQEREDLKDKLQRNQWERDELLGKKFRNNETIEKIERELDA